MRKVKELFRAHVLESTLVTSVSKPGVMMSLAKIVEPVPLEKLARTHVLVQVLTVEQTVKQAFATITLVSMVVHALIAVTLLSTRANALQAIQVKVIESFLNYAF